MHSADGPPVLLNWRVARWTEREHSQTPQELLHAQGQVEPSRVTSELESAPVTSGLEPAQLTMDMGRSLCAASPQYPAAFRVLRRAP